MEKIKKISAALIALTMACGLMASCGESESSKDSTKDTTTTTAAETEETEADAESEEDETAETEEGEGDAEGGDSAAAGDTVPDPSYQHKYEFDGYDAFLMFSDLGGWFWANMTHEGSVHKEGFDATDPNAYGYGVDADITGDGEYTVSITKDSIYQNNGVINPQALINEDDGTIFAAEGAQVFCVDIVGLCDGDHISGLNPDTNEWEMDQEAKQNKLKDGDNHYDEEAKGDYNPADLTVKLVSIKCDGVEVPFDESKVRYGNIEDNNNRYRIEIYNSYGTTATDGCIDPFAINFNKSLEVTFTIEGLGEVKTFPEVEPFAADGAAAPADEAAAETTEETAAAEETTAAEEDAKAE